jgi:hypothetical protein
VLFHFAQTVEPEPPWLPHIVETFGIEDSRPKVPKKPGTTTISVSKAWRTS